MINQLEKHGLWTRLTRPALEVPKAERRAASLLASLLIARFGVHTILLLMGVTYVVTGRESSWFGIRINVVGIAVSGIMYVLSRSRSYKIAAVILVIETI